ncbi:RadC protein [[Mannheimia] succiniciproducens MBEL55E]|uniref:RadC protein n=1 Tax=Mannheimia succiniciproducens (strain KCTC 0769BP / MBEL55E) TaxID=221988 RepID=Q65R64_MANSM|nr:RadC protein [[Mannheimia] succiniciproducens MBEL55E]
MDKLSDADALKGAKLCRSALINCRNEPKCVKTASESCITGQFFIPVRKNIANNSLLSKVLAPNFNSFSRGIRFSFSICSIRRSPLFLIEGLLCVENSIMPTELDQFFETDRKNKIFSSLSFEVECQNLFVFILCFLNYGFWVPEE